jgi:hypothetical protein
MSNGNKKHLRNELHNVCFSQCFDKNKKNTQQLGEMEVIGQSREIENVLWYADIMQKMLHY